MGEREISHCRDLHPTSHVQLVRLHDKVLLGQFPLRDALKPVGQRNDLIALFSLAFEIAAEQPEKAVLRYAVARVQGMTVSAKGWRAFQNCLLGAVGADPATLAVSLGTLFQVAASSGQTVAKAPLAKVFEAVIMTHAPRAQGSEVAWALWGALAWSVPLSDAAAKVLSTMDDDVVALLALDADARGLFPAGSLDKQHWENAANQSDSLHGEHWLLAYESHRQKWLTVQAVKGHPIFKAMHAAGVSFYDRSKNVPQFPAAARGIPGGTLPDFYA